MGFLDLCPLEPASPELLPPFYLFSAETQTRVADPAWGWGPLLPGARLIGGCLNRYSGTGVLLWESIVVQDPI